VYVEYTEPGQSNHLALGARPAASASSTDATKLIRATYFGWARRRWVVRWRDLEQARIASR
jgi:hypothetical protein